MKIFTAEQIRNWDKCTIARAGISSTKLMENAATACLKWIKKKLHHHNNFIIFCGTGNNGGDGLALARLLHKSGCSVKVYVLQSNKQSADFLYNLQKMPRAKTTIHFIENVKDFPAMYGRDVVVDALFGTGLNRPLNGLAARLVQHINKAKAQVISIDIPSGLMAEAYTGDEAWIVKAGHTLSFQVNKLAFFMPGNIEYTGEVALLPIGLNEVYYAETPAVFETADRELIKKIYKPRNPFAHKYSFGHALIYAGSKHMMGAGVLCCKACVKTGAGLVSIMVEPGCEQVIHISLPEAITTAEKDTGKSWIKKSVVAMGPGLEASSKNKTLLKKLLSNWKGPLVLDATALSLLSPFIKLLPLRTEHPVILTPHTGEFEKLFGKSTNDFARVKSAVDKAKSLHCYIILKGHYTLIATPEGNHFFNTTGNAGMATAGSGDTLTGIVCGLLCQGYTEKDACIFGVYIHGLAGDIAAGKLSQEAMLASDISENLGEAYKAINGFGLK